MRVATKFYQSSFLVVVVLSGMCACSSPPKTVSANELLDDPRLIANDPSLVNHLAERIAGIGFQPDVKAERQFHAIAAAEIEARLINETSRDGVFTLKRGTRQLDVRHCGEAVAYDHRSLSDAMNSRYLDGAIIASSWFSPTLQPDSWTCLYDAAKQRPELAALVDAAFPEQALQLAAGHLESSAKLVLVYRYYNTCVAHPEHRDPHGEHAPLTACVPAELAPCGEGALDRELCLAAGDTAEARAGAIQSLARQQWGQWMTDYIERRN